MNNKFDKKLINKIEQSFQELDVPFEVEHWNALRAKIESPKIHSILLPTIMKIAAVFLVGIALSIFYFSIPENEIPIANYEDLPPAIEQSPPELSPIDPQQQTTNNKETLSSNNLEAIQEDHQGDSTTLTNPMDSQTIELNRISSSLLNIKTIPPVYIFDDSTMVLTKNLIHEEPLVKNSIYIQKNDLKAVKPELSVLAATNIGFSAAENGAPVGYSTGIISAFSLTRKISVSSGLVVSHQNLQIENTGSNITLESSLSEIQELTRANLLALDIPVNFRYHIKSSGITRSFVSIGFSSLLFLQQEFKFTSRQVTEEVSVEEDGSIIISRRISEQQTRSSSPAFSRFDAASMLNISLGFQYSLSPHSDIVIEPFIKYPLRSLTAQNVQYGSGGIQFRVVF